MIRAMVLMVIAIIAIYITAYIIYMVISSHYIAVIHSDSTSFIVWIAPWGYYVDPASIPFYLVAGVVIAYDCDYSINSSFLRKWFNYSIELIGKLRSMGRGVFINLFCEKYIPTWIWRGYLSNVKIHKEIIDGLKNVIGDGNGTYIGFSELTTCINDTKCRIKLVGIYKQLGREFPGSKLYYYGSGEDHVEAIQDLYQRAGLSLAGIDIWDLECSNFQFYIRSSGFHCWDLGRYPSGEGLLALSPQSSGLDTLNPKPSKLYIIKTADIFPENLKIQSATESLALSV